MALRVPKTELTTEIKNSMIVRFGAVAEPVEATWHNPRVTETIMEMGGKVSRWDAVHKSLKSLAHIAVAARVGCSSCLDIGYFQAMNKDLDLAKASQVPRWRDSDLFTPLERDLLEYSEAMTNTPPTITDELSASLLDRVGPAAMIELTVYISYCNFATRNNVALGIEPQGFAATCEIPLGAHPHKSAVAWTA